ncbi:FecR/PupR family sigma factor regulator [Paraburkholderia kururiensis]|jgi:ferric-dicitrate binding protein FerR (iron transport regulator)|uniref:DUF4880 domain-containing protein n=1 Tax=Paraburkholderia kururiensis TaxID=984307 RepID=A0ABZ0WRB2_9BURK|nr:DUF4880 domain-containing protein [Paraburkholderia kururiensis]WQD79950.1 DUF4880 domain-containing protein [Paraburkholderia kururiensis]
MKVSQLHDSSCRTHTVSAQIRDAAVRWVLWLRSREANEADREAFRRWRMQSEAHARAARDIVWLWKMLGMPGREATDWASSVH